MFCLRSDVPPDKFRLFVRLRCLDPDRTGRHHCLAVRHAAPDATEKGAGLICAVGTDGILLETTLQHFFTGSDATSAATRGAICIGRSRRHGNSRNTGIDPREVRPPCVDMFLGHEVALCERDYETFLLSLRDVCGE